MLRNLWMASMIGLLLAGSPAYGQQQCATGVRCGDRCIPANTPCRLGVARDTAAADSTDSAAKKIPAPTAVAVPKERQRPRRAAAGVTPSDRGYHRDSRGRCYTFDGKGKPAYVDGRLCN